MAITLDQFRNSASGNWNLGQVILGANNTLKHVNNHKWNIAANNVKVAGSQNADVRKAFYDSVAAFVQSRLGVGEKDSNAYLIGLRGRLLEGGNEVKNLTRQEIHAILNEIDNRYVYKGVKEVNVDVANNNAVAGRDQDGPYTLLRSARSYRNLTGLTQKAINRICRNEGVALRAIVNELKHGKENGMCTTEEQIAFEVTALRQLAGTIRLKSDAMVDGDAKVAVKMLENQFPQESIVDKPAVADALCKGLNELSASGKDEFVFGAGSPLEGLKLGKMKDGRLSVAFGSDRMDLDSIVLDSAHGIEKAIAHLEAKKVAGNADLQALQRDLLKSVADRWTKSTDVKDFFVKSDILKHGRTIAEILLPKWTGNQVSSAACDKISMDHLMACAKAVAGHIGQNAIGNAGDENTLNTVTISKDADGIDIADCIKNDGKDTAYSVKFKEFVDCYNTLGPKDKKTDSATMEIDFLSKVVFSVGNGGNAEDIKTRLTEGKNILREIVRNCADEEYYDKLGTMAKKVINPILLKSAEKRLAAIKENNPDSTLPDTCGTIEDFRKLSPEILKKLTVDDFTEAELLSLAESIKNDVDMTFNGAVRGLSERLGTHFDANSWFDSEKLKGKLPGDGSDDYQQLVTKGLGQTNFIGQNDLRNALYDNETKETNPTEYNEKLYTAIATKGKAANLLHALMKPEEYACKGNCTRKEWDSASRKEVMTYEFVSPMKEGRYLKSDDVFDLLAATLTSPKKIRECFTDNAKKPSVDGAVDIVSTMVKSMFQGADARGFYETGKGGEDVYDFDKAIEELAGFLNEPPACLDKDFIKNYLSADTIRENIASGASDVCPEFTAMLRDMPASVTSAILKGICRHLIHSGLTMYPDFDQDARDNNKGPTSSESNFGGYLHDNVDPIYEKMKAWREPIGDISAVKVGETTLKDVMMPSVGNPPVTNNARFALLDPERAGQFAPGSGNAAAKDKEDANRFVKTVLPKYLDKLQNESGFKAKMMKLMASERIDFPESGGLNWQFFGQLAKGFGPIMQKFLQGFELPVDATEGMRDAFGNLKSKLTELPMEYVNAQLEYIKKSSGGRIEKLDFDSFVGCATVGAAVKCKIKTLDSEGTKECVVKLLRPDVNSQMFDEEALINTILEEDKTGLKDVNEKRIESILKETDFGIEHDGIGHGCAAYNGQRPDISSVNSLSYVLPDSTFVIMDFVDGTPVDRIISGVDGQAKSFRKINGKMFGRLAELRQMTSEINTNAMEDLNTINEWAGDVKKILERRKKLIETRRRVSSTIQAWLQAALKDPKGFYHGDLHAGNLMLDKNAEHATVIDYGNFGHLTEVQRNAIANLYTSVFADSKQNPKEFLTQLETLGFSFTNIDMNKLEEGIDNILNSGAEQMTPEKKFERLSRALNFLSKQGCKPSSSLHNFLDAQIRLSNSLNGINMALQYLDQALHAASPAQQWYIDDWPLEESQFNDTIRNITDVLEKDGIAVQQKSAKLFPDHKEAVDLDQVISGIKELATGQSCDQMSFASVVGEVVQSWKSAA